MATFVPGVVVAGPLGWRFTNNCTCTPEDVRTTCGRRIIYSLKRYGEVKCDTNHNQQIGSWIKVYGAIMALLQKTSGTIWPTAGSMKSSNCSPNDIDLNLQAKVGHKYSNLSKLSNKWYQVMTFCLVCLKKAMASCYITSLSPAPIIT